MPIFNAIVIPDLEFYFGMFVKSTTLNKEEIPFPVQLKREDLYQDKSFIRLLFDDNWPTDEAHTSYFFCYHERACPENWPQIVIDRAKVYAPNAQYYIACDSTASFAINIFGLASDDTLMLDQLLLYRLNPYVYGLGIPYSSLTTNLSKLIWHYLNLKVNQDYAPYDNLTPIADPNITIENMYESYIIENIFAFVQDKNVKGR